MPDWSSQAFEDLKLKTSKQPKTTTRILMPESKQTLCDINGSPKTPDQASHTQFHPGILIFGLPFNHLCFIYWLYWNYNLIFA